MRTLSERFEAFVHIEPNCGCWLWTGAVNGKGYGKMRVEGVLVAAHRVSWGLYRGSMPPKSHVLHSCDMPCCVNPAHLWLGTNADNVADKMAKRRHPQANQITCRSGHLLSGPNLYTHPTSGRRVCRACRKRFCATYRQRQKDAAKVSGLASTAAP